VWIGPPMVCECGATATTANSGRGTFGFAAARSRRSPSQPRDRSSSSTARPFAHQIGRALDTRRAGRHDVPRSAGRCAVAFASLSRAEPEARLVRGRRICCLSQRRQLSPATMRSDSVGAWRGTRSRSCDRGDIAHAWKNGAGYRPLHVWLVYDVPPVSRAGVFRRDRARAEQLHGTYKANDSGVAGQVGVRQRFGKMLAVRLDGHAISCRARPASPTWSATTGIGESGSASARC